MKSLKRITVFASFVLVAIFTNFAQAQTSTSTGRSNVVTESTNSNEYRQIVKIRKLINEGAFDKAEVESLKVINTEDRRRRFGSSFSPFYLDAYNALCVSLTGAMKVVEALEACNKSLELTPENWESLKSRATLHYMTQNFSNSLADFKLSLENAPDNKAITDVLKQNIGVVESKINQGG